jgi:hypothetical protein
LSKAARLAARYPAPPEIRMFFPKKSWRGSGEGGRLFT